MNRAAAPARPDAHRYPVWRLAAYGAMGAPLAAMLLPLYIYLPAFYATEGGLTLATVGAVLLGARLWDMVIDPLVGLASDRIPIFGTRRKGMILIGVVPTALAVWQLFRPGDDASAGYLLVWSLVLYAGGTLIMLPYQAWGAEVTDDYDERSRISAAREISVVLGTLIAAALPTILSAGGTEATGPALATLAVGVAIFLPLTALAASRSLPEARVRSGGFVLSRRSLASVLSNGPFRRLIAAYVLNGIANGLPATLFLLFVEHRLGAPERAGILLLIYFGMGIVAVPFWLWLARRIGKDTAWVSAMVWACIVFLTVLALGEGDWLLFLAVCIATGASVGADLVLPVSMQADVVDLDRVRNRQERAGLFFGLWGMATKLALALAVGIAFPILGLVGFDVAGGSATSADHGTTALWTLSLLYAGVPVAFKLGAIALMWRFPIDRRRQAQLARIVRRRDARAAASG